MVALSRLLDWAAKLLAIAFSCQRGFEAAFFTWWDEKGMSLYFSNYIFLLYFALETSQSTLERLAIA